MEKPLEPGPAHDVIDWPRRFEHMQQHAADHMIANAIYRLWNGTTIGLHLGEEVSTIDVAMPDGVTRITPEQIAAVEDDVNARIQRDVLVKCWFPSPEELATLPLRKAPTVKEHVRVAHVRHGRHRGEDEAGGLKRVLPSGYGREDSHHQRGAGPYRRTGSGYHPDQYLA